jgi:hypothetical protein
MYFAPRRNPAFTSSQVRDEFDQTEQKMRGDLSEDGRTLQADDAPLEAIRFGLSRQDCYAKHEKSMALHAQQPTPDPFSSLIPRTRTPGCRNRDVFLHELPRTYGLDSTINSLL